MTVYRVSFEEFDFHGDSRSAYWARANSFLVEEPLAIIQRLLSTWNGNLITAKIEANDHEIEEAREYVRQWKAKDTKIDSMTAQEVKDLGLTKTSQSAYDNNAERIERRTKQNATLNDLKDHSDMTLVGRRWTVKEEETLSIEQLKEMEVY